MNKENVVEKAIDSLKEVKNEIIDEEMDITNITHHLRKARNFVSILIWEIGKIANKIENENHLSNFEIQGNSGFPLIPNQLPQKNKFYSEIEEALALLLVNNDFSLKEWNKLIDFFDFIKPSIRVENEPATPNSNPA